MSTTDPLIKELKEYTSSFLQGFHNNTVIWDDHKNLRPFCICLERIFIKGLIVKVSTLGLHKTPYAWSWLEKVDCSNYNYSNARDIVTCSKNLYSPNGKLRLLIRACLVKKCLHIPIITLIKNFPCQKIYQSTGSIIGDEILVQVLLSVLMQCSKFKFELDLQNSSFLDFAWELPKVLKLEFVPCKSLGLSVRYAYEKAIIVEVQTNGIAADDGSIEIGDILDELNGMHVSTYSRGNLAKIMKKGAGQPISIKVIKAKISETEIYMPVVPLLKHIKIDVQIFGQHNKETAKKTCPSPGYVVTYIGTVCTGNAGEVKKIENAVRLILSPFLKPENRPKIKKIQKEVCFEIGEIGIRCVASQTGQEMVTHSYMEISSCGSVSGLKHYFAFIAGDDICNIARNFTCHVFHSKNDEEVSTILSSIGQGFYRTHYAV